MRLVRYGRAIGSSFSNRPGGSFATPGPAVHFEHLENILRSAAWPATRSDWLVCATSDNQVLNRSAGGSDDDSQGEKVPCSEGIYSGASEFSSVQNNQTEQPEKNQGKEKENPEGRRISKAKKEENSSANLSKKTQKKKIHFKTIRFRPLSSHQ